MTLYQHSTFAEICEYAALCLEHGVKTVRLEKQVYDRVKSLIRPHVGERAFAGVKFKLKISE